jgi:hypothetical protein
VSCRPRPARRSCPSFQPASRQRAHDASEVSAPPCFGASVLVPCSYPTHPP